MSEPPPSKDTPPLTFHPAHGSDIDLSNNGTTARRSSITHTGLVFSSQPIAPNQKFSLKLSELCDKTKDIISIGFTPQEPTTDLDPTYSIKIASQLKLHHVKNKLLHFYFTRSGAIHFGMEGQSKGTSDAKCPTDVPLWAFVRLHHTPTTLELVNSQRPNWSTLDSLPLMLHQSRGRNVKLLKNSAYKFDRRLNVSYAFTGRSLQVGEHVVVKILDVDARSRGGLGLGLTSCDPASLTLEDLPDNLEELVARPKYWLSVGDPTWQFKPYDEISFLVGRNGDMKIWRNWSTLLKVVPVEEVGTLWAFIDVSNVEGVEVRSCLLSGGEENVVVRPELSGSTLVFADGESGESTDDVECVICYDRKIEAALYPCGHMCMCYECARQQWRGAGHGKCPMCRVMIRDVLKIYKT